MSSSRLCSALYRSENHSEATHPCLLSSWNTSGDRSVPLPSYGGGSCTLPEKSARCFERASTSRISAMAFQGCRARVSASHRRLLDSLPEDLQAPDDGILPVSFAEKLIVAGGDLALDGLERFPYPLPVSIDASRRHGRALAPRDRSLRGHVNFCHGLLADPPRAAVPGRDPLARPNHRSRHLQRPDHEVSGRQLRRNLSCPPQRLISHGQQKLSYWRREAGTSCDPGRVSIMRE